MRSGRLRALMRLSIPLWLLPAFVGCVTARPIVTAQSACSSLIPDPWRSGVGGAPLYGPAPTAGDLVAFADAQTASLDKANGRTADSIAIIEACEARDRQAAAQLERPWWRFWN